MNHVVGEVGEEGVPDHRGSHSDERSGLDRTPRAMSNFFR